MKDARGVLGRAPLFIVLVLLVVVLLVAAGISWAQEPDGNTGPAGGEDTTLDTTVIPPASGDEGAPAGDGPLSVDATGPVLLIQDQLPWGYNSIQTVLTAHGITFDQILSSQLASTNLSSYKMIISPSQQPAAYVTNWNNNIAKVENYVSNGGKLWLSTSYVDGTSKTPGGIVSNPDVDSTNIVALNDHPWVRGVPPTIRGSAASEESFSNIYPGAKVIATDSSSGRPVLLDYKFGAGRVLLTGMTLEFAWAYTGAFPFDAGPILENSIVDMLGARVLLIRDQNTWGTGIQQILNNHNISFNETTSSQIGTVSLSPYDLVIIANAQLDAFNTALNNNITKFRSYVNDGGKLWHGTITFGSVIPLTVGSESLAQNSDSQNLQVAKGHPWLDGVPDPIDGTSASHMYFTGGYAGATVVVKGAATGLPTLLDYRYGNGRVLLTGQTLTYAWANNQDGKQILENSILDLLASKLYIPMVVKNVCANRETEHNDGFGQANRICIGVPVKGSPDNDSPAELDFFTFEWNAQGTLQVDLNNFVANGQLILYKDTTELPGKDFTPGPGNSYQVINNGAAGPGTYYVLVTGPAGQAHSGDYTLTVTVK